MRERKFYTDWAAQQWLIWQTRTISTFVAATVPVEQAGETSPLLDQAYAIGDLTKADPDDTTTTKKPAPHEPANGSFERFMGSLGSPHRWAGAN